MAKKNTELSFYHRKSRPWVNEPLDRAVIVGHTTINQTKIWVRMKEQGHYVLLISTRPIFEGDLLAINGSVHEKKKGKFTLTSHPVFKRAKDRVLYARYPFSLSFDKDNTHVIEVLNLKEDSRYHYAVAKFIEGEKKEGAGSFKWELGHENDVSFMTMKETYDSFNFGLYSCHMPYAHGVFEDKVDAHLWNDFSRELAREKARFVIGAGDQVYVDGNKNVNIWRWLEKVRDQAPSDSDMVSWYRDIYRGYWGFPKLQEVYQSYPNYMIWDDHEIMDGWGSYNDEELSQKIDTLFRWENVNDNVKLAKRMFIAAKKVYMEYQHAHNPSTKKEVWDYDFNGCGADFFVLDMRGHRTVNKILGSQQHARLNKWLGNLKDKKTNVLPIFIVSPVPVVHLKDIAMNLADWAVLFGTRDDVRDHWEHNSHTDELDQFLEDSFSTADKLGRPLVFLSGDVHVGLIAKIVSRKYPHVKAYQVTSSGISYEGLNSVSRMALEASAKKQGYIKGNKDYLYDRHWIYAGNNFSLIRIKQENNKLLEIEVSIQGNTGEDQSLQTYRVNLLSL
ncbi:MAG: alkaline phosphatase family protein [Methylococcales bacterium]|nr:alkaline phosphatase family protein [Methylococcales bacterium]